MCTDLLSLSHSLSNFVVGMEGNVSKKENNVITIKASGTSLKNLSPKDLVDFNLNGEQISNHNKKGSMELSFHTYLYENFDIIIFNGKKSCVIPYAKPGIPLMNMIGVHLESFIKTENFFPNVILLKNHGLITCGKTILECIYATEICEKSAEIFMGKYKPNFLTEDEVNDLLNDDKEKYRIKQL